MPPRKRNLSPSAASSASSTPIPPSVPSTSTALQSSSFSALHTSFGAQGGSEGLAGPGPTTLEHQSKAQKEERREFARLGAAVPYSGDGLGSGEECYLWTDIPTVKNFRYAPCTLSPTTSPHPLVPFHRTIPYPPPIPPVHISWLDRSAFLRMSHTALTISNDRGYRSARANVAVREGSWYFEVKIERGIGSQGASKGHLGAGDAGNAHVRVGWGRREAHIDAPVGADGYSYAIRDVGGEKVTLSRPRPYGNEFKTGDVVGCLIVLPPRDQIKECASSKEDPAYIKRQRRHFKHKGQSYFESAEYMPSKEMESLVDREGKQAAAAKAAAAASEPNNGTANGNGTVNSNGHRDSGEKTNGNGTGGGLVKKGATTKNTKKGKKEVVVTPTAPVVRVPPKLPSSSIAFYLNGEALGEAFADLYDFTPLPPLYLPADRGKKHGHGHGSSGHPDQHDLEEITMHDDGTLGYYPMVSCYGKGKASFNPGPVFDFPPSDLDFTSQIQGGVEIKQEGAGTSVDQSEVPLGQNQDSRPQHLVAQKTRVRPMCERWAEFRLEETAYDERDEAEDTMKLLKILEEEERQRKAYLDGSKNGGGSKKKRAVAAKKKKVIHEHNHELESRGPSASVSRAGTMTPAPLESEPESMIESKGELAFGENDETTSVKREVEQEGGPGVVLGSTVTSRQTSPIPGGDNSFSRLAVIPSQDGKVASTPASPDRSFGEMDIDQLPEESIAKEDDRERGNDTGVEMASQVGQVNSEDGDEGIRW